jgi:flagellar basal body-associated protein FliL
VKTYQRREQEQEKSKPGTTFLSCVFVVIVAAVSILLAGLVMEQIDFYEAFGLRGSEIPLIKVPGNEIPPSLLQIVLAVVIFFLLQALVVIFAGLFTGHKREEEITQPPPNPWER